ncbi:ABC transporter permease subunit [Candidatus Pelagibacter bacterium]|jgi:glycine betaine/proline transport system permease protein|uniref:ABC transporter permease n=1 Tax=Pelagibacter ubique TaxID=198252 RepID=UPI00094C6272|nr:ABC transporter permease subunit [Candidatus Pelagibacter ubique]MDA9684534.1 ABC transporter permease subunit [Candidatus Pelagibacter bacterium]MDC2987362.1 ABC transporter permease subunit [Candidatus Pelagibacter bacterium]
MSLKLAPSDYEIYIPLGEWIEGNIKEWLFEQRPLFKKISAPIDTVLNSLDSLFNFIPFPIILLIFVIFAYRTNGIKFAIFSFLSLLFIDLVDLWSESMTTLAMIFTAVLFCMLIGIPLGIIASRSNTFEIILRPILDIMQTIPSFVYLIPVVMLFGVGLTPGVVATIIFALPPIIRLTNLGIRQVGKGFKEAGSSLGLTKFLILIKIEIPLSLKTIMAGVNQTLMLALSMVVIAALIGAGGLGLTVYIALGRLDVGSAVIGGTGIVILAIILDRITQKIIKSH